MTLMREEVFTEIGGHNTKDHRIFTPLTAEPTYRHVSLLPGNPAMSLFMMKVRLGLAAGSASGGTLPRPVSQYDASPLTPPSSDCGGDLDDVQAETVTSGRRDVLSESQQVRGLKL